MRQHQPSPAITTGSPPAAAPQLSGAPLLRLLVAFALGLTSTLFFSPVDRGPWWWQPVAASVLLLLFALVSLALAQGAQNGIERGRVLRALVAAGVVLGALECAFLAARQMAYAVGSPPGTGPEAAPWIGAAAALVPIVVGVASALVAQQPLRASLAMGGAALGWLGACIANAIVALLNPNPSGVVTGLIIVLGLSLVGFALALLGGVVGWGLGALARGGSARGQPHGRRRRGPMGHLELVDAFSAALNAQAWDTVASYLTDDFICDIGVIRTTGKQAYIAFQMAWFAAAPDFHVTWSNAREDGDTLYCTTDVSGTQTNPLAFPGQSVIPATGKRFFATFETTVKWREDKMISNTLEPTSTRTILEQLGV